MNDVMYVRILQLCMEYQMNVSYGDKKGVIYGCMYKVCNQLY